MSKITHTSHTCQAAVVSCMDFRLQEMIHRWAIKNIEGGFDRVAVAGGVKNLPFVLEQVSLSDKFHHISLVYLINHEDCGAYGKEGTFEKHKTDLLFAQKSITQKFPELNILLFYLKLNGELIKIK